MRFNKKSISISSYPVAQAKASAELLPKRFIFLFESLRRFCCVTGLTLDVDSSLLALRRSSGHGYNIFDIPGILDCISNRVSDFSDSKNERWIYSKFVAKGTAPSNASVNLKHFRIYKFKLAKHRRLFLAVFNNRVGVILVDYHTDHLVETHDRRLSDAVSQLSCNEDGIYEPKTCLYISSAESAFDKKEIVSSYEQACLNFNASLPTDFIKDDVVFDELLSDLNVMNTILRPDDSRFSDFELKINKWTQALSTCLPRHAHFYFNASRQLVVVREHKERCLSVRASQFIFEKIMTDLQAIMDPDSFCDLILRSYFADPCRMDGLILDMDVALFTGLFAGRLRNPLFSRFIETTAIQMFLERSRQLIATDDGSAQLVLENVYRLSLAPRILSRWLLRTYVETNNPKCIAFLTRLVEEKRLSYFVLRELDLPDQAPCVKLRRLIDEQLAIYLPQATAAVVKSSGGRSSRRAAKKQKKLRAKPAPSIPSTIVDLKAYVENYNATDWAVFCKVILRSIQKIRSVDPRLLSMIPNFRCSSLNSGFDSTAVFLSHLPLVYVAAVVSPELLRECLVIDPKLVNQRFQFNDTVLDSLLVFSAKAGNAASFELLVDADADIFYVGEYSDTTINTLFQQLLCLKSSKKKQALSVAVRCLRDLLENTSNKSRLSAYFKHFFHYPLAVNLMVAGVDVLLVERVVDISNIDMASIVKYFSSFCRSRSGDYQSLFRRKGVVLDGVAQEEYCYQPFSVQSVFLKSQISALVLNQNLEKMTNINDYLHEMVRLKNYEGIATFFQHILSSQNFDNIMRCLADMKKRGIDIKQLLMNTLVNGEPLVMCLLAFSDDNLECLFKE